MVSAEWRATTAGLPADAIDPGVYGQYTAAVARWQERDQAAREAGREASARAAGENLARLQDLADSRGSARRDGARSRCRRRRRR